AVEVLSPGRRELLLAGWNDTARSVPGVTVAELFERQAARTPDAVAVVCGEEEIRYARLEERASRLAGVLVGWGVGAESVVAVAMDRSVDLVVVLLAVLKAGGAYLPVDLGHPAQRVGFMLGDARPVCVVCDRVLPDVLAEVVSGGGLEIPVLTVDGNSVTDAPRPSGAGAGAGAGAVDGWRGPVLSSHPMYVMYTSGSTGTPKGVVVTHEAVVNHLLGRIEEFAPEGVRVAGPAEGPFVLVRMAQAAAVRRQLRVLGYAVRRGDTFPGLDEEWVRIAVRDRVTVNRFLLALDQALVFVRA
ncbi:AMP-binding protein, partial [Streptomyces shenzhenensis]|uniref:AMP-binding protein n=1 Tax=Streptomyces shenzhenensis TaxID=943815 RepID=UPI0015F0F59B